MPTHKIKRRKKHEQQTEFDFTSLFNEKDESLSIEEKINKEANEDREIRDRDEIEKLSSWTVSPVLSNNLSKLLSYSTKKFDEIISWTPQKRFEDKLSNLEIDETAWKMWASNTILTPLIDKNESDQILSLKNEELVAFIRAMNKKYFDEFCEFVISIEPKHQNHFWEIALFRVGVELLGRIGSLKFGAKYQERAWTGKCLKENCIKKTFKTSSQDYKEIGFNFINCFIGENAIIEKWTLEYRGGLWRINIFNNSQKQSIYIEETETNI
jgi:hypothetical protein